MGAVYNQYTLTATGKYLLVPAGAGMGSGGWQVTVSGTFVGSGLLKQATSAPGSALVLGSAITYYNATTLASSTAAITAATSVIVPDTGSDLYLDLTYTSGAMLVMVTAAGIEIGQEQGNLSEFNPTFFGTLASAAGVVALGASPSTNGAIRVDVSSYSTYVLEAKNGTGISRWTQTANGGMLFGMTSNNDLTLTAQGGQAKWVVTGSSGISSLSASQATARLIGGSSNGFAVRNSGDARDNLLIADNGTTMTLTDSSARTVIIGTTGGAGEFSAGAFYYAGLASAASTTIAAWNAAGSQVQLAYHDGLQYRSGVEIASTTGFGTLALMKSGGAVVIGTDTGGSSTLRVGGSVMIAGGSFLQFWAKAGIKAEADGILTLIDNAATSFVRLNFGGTSASFPALKREGAALGVVLADNSAYATVNVAAVNANNAITSSSASAGVGYSTGAGGTQTQNTSKVTAFTLNKTCGTITFAADALGADTTTAGATWTNSAIAATDIIVWNHISGGTLGAYQFSFACSAGSAVVKIRNMTPGSLSEAPVIAFAVIKCVTA